MAKTSKSSTLERYAELIGAATVKRITEKSKQLQGLRLAEVNSTLTGGGVAELLASMTELQQSLGIKAERIVIEGSKEFFTVTKKIHNALQGASAVPTKAELAVYQQVAEENAARLKLDHDAVIIHDPQPLPLIAHTKQTSPWIWRCHIDLSAPNPKMWQYLAPLIERYDAVIESLPAYRQDLAVSQTFWMPAIDPFSLKNAPMTKAEAEERFERYEIPRDLPLVTQISRFDRWKDPLGVIEAFKLASREVPATLVLLGNFVTDDPESAPLYEELRRKESARIRVLPHGDDLDLVNALQWHADVVIQKSLQEGFGLTVTEAMWKGRPVIGGDTDGIRAQIKDGVNGVIVKDVDAAAARLIELLKHPSKGQRLGKAAHQTVQREFLMTRLLEQQLDRLISLTR